MPVAAREDEQGFTRSPVGYVALRFNRGRKWRIRKRRRSNAGREHQGVINCMAQEIITLECTEAKALGKPASRYMSTRNKKSPQTPNRLEKKKYNPFLKKHTLHREVR